MKGTPAIPSGPEGIPQQEPAPADASGREKPQSRRALRGIPRLADRHAPPLSFAQEKVWLLDQLEPGSPVYNRPLALRLTGSLDESALRRAVQTLVDRHEVLRTRFKVRDGQPQQVISPNLALDMAVVELSELAPSECESRAKRLATEESLRPFDLAQDSVLRATLLRLGKQEHVLLLVFHHIAFDAWSARVFIEEFANLYIAR